MKRVAQGALALGVATAIAWLLDPGTPPEEWPASSEEAPQPDTPLLTEVVVLPPEPDPPPAASAPVERVDVEPSPPPHARPESAPAAQPAPAPARPPARVPSDAEVRRGQALLDAGAFPRVRATYARIGFGAYRDAMLALGGRFFLFDPARRTPVAEVDPASGAVLGERMPRGLSRWPRDVTRHVPAILSRGQSVYGPRVSRVVLLPPAGVDAALLGALDQGMRKVGLEPGQASVVDVAYELRRGRLHCAVLAVTLRDAGQRALPLVVDLSGAGVRS
jgi:hypothetical protein